MDAMLSDHRHPCIRNLNSTVPVDFVRVKSYVNSLFNSTRVPVRILVNKLNLVPEWIMSGLIDMFRNGWSFSSWKPFNVNDLINAHFQINTPYANYSKILGISKVIQFILFLAWLKKLWEFILCIVELKVRID